MQNNRIVSLDMAKGIAIFLVVLTHSIGIPYIGRYFFSFYLQMFFFISGMTFTKDLASRKEIGTCIKNRVKQLLFPYFIYSVILLIARIFIDLLSHSLKITNVLSAVLGIVYGKSFYVAPRVENQFYDCFNAALWFVPCMFVSFIIFSLCKYLFLRKRIIGIFAWGGVFIGGLLCCYLPIYLPWSADIALTGAIFMGAGDQMKEVTSLKIEKKNIIPLAAIVGVYVVLCSFNGSVSMSIRDYGGYGVVSYICYYLIGIIGSILCIILCHTIENTNLRKVLAPLGKATFYIMSVHILCLNILQKILPLWSSGWRYFISFVVVAVLIFVIMIIRALIQKYTRIRLR